MSARTPWGYFDDAIKALESVGIEGGERAWKEKLGSNPSWEAVVKAGKVLNTDHFALSLKGAVKNLEQEPALPAFGAQLVTCAWHWPRECHRMSNT